MTKKIAQVDPDAGIEKIHGHYGQAPGASSAGSRKREGGRRDNLNRRVIISTDVLILTVNEQDNIIEQLERYISPGGY